MSPVWDPQEIENQPTSTPFSEGVVFFRQQCQFQGERTIGGISIAELPASTQTAQALGAEETIDVAAAVPPVR